MVLLNAFIFDPITWGLLALLFWAILFLTIQSRRTQKKREDAARRFLAEEENAGNLRQRPPEEGLFYTPQLDLLPPLPPGDPHKVERAAKRKMIRFPEPMSNAELKSRYGRGQLEYLAHYEENYDDYLRCLTKWADALMKENKNPDAKGILEHTVALGSEFRNSYKFLSDIYAGEGNADKLNELLLTASAATFRDPANGNHIIEYIQRHLTAFPR